jgi:hypothetical protein
VVVVKVAQVVGVKAVLVAVVKVRVVAVGLEDVARAMPAVGRAGQANHQAVVEATTHLPSDCNSLK